MEKKYSITYKVHFYERLQKVNFHGTLTFPLYVQVTFDRRSIIFKSYYFELFSKPQYAMLKGRRIIGPALKDIIEKENELINFIIDKNLDNFSLKLFQSEYLLYSKDLCDITQESCREYLYVYFKDKGMPSLAFTLKQGNRTGVLYELIEDLKISLQPASYKELIENSFYYAEPYLPIYGFMRTIKKWPMLCLTVMEWEDEKIKDSFVKYVNSYFKNQETTVLMNQIKRFITSFKNPIK
ncbi:hypothetical protein [Ferruginibacter sp.]